MVHLCYYFVECTPSSSTAEHHEKQIEHGNFVVKDISALYLDNRFSDVVLIVDEVQLPVHRAILASRSEYFRSLLFGGLQESGKPEVNISNAPLASFKIILEYIYTGRMNLNDLKDKVIVELLSLSNLYELSGLQYTLSQYLSNNINVHNVCSLFAMSRLCLPKISAVKSPEYLLNFIETHALDVLQSEDFLSLSAGALQEILIRDSFYADELEIFRAVYRWIIENQDYLECDATNKVLSVVRYPLMCDDELNEVSMTLQMVSLERISDTIPDAKLLRNTVSPHELQFRVQQNVNLIHGSQGVLDIKEYDGVAMITLGRLAIINKITILFGDNDSGDYSYYIDVSIDGNHWVRVIDYSDYFCRSVQDLWILKQLVRYIRIVSTKNTGYKKFQLLDVSYNTERWDSVKIENGFVAPEYNVATESMNATVNEGSGCIRIQLAQPYILSSMRMLLWDDDNLCYSYTVEVSANNQDWVMIMNNSMEKTRGWQVLQFKPRPIVFIRITGVRNLIGIFFRCVYFEAPAQIPLHSPYPDRHDVTHYWENNKPCITVAEAPVQKHEETTDQQDNDLGHRCSIS
ncbi:BTB/POZ domain-containing protein 9-like [Adelges cooleyi]|uniref:BTB/POZ domain-containing protein 9-like n=1 Tax=Adelges cooleyi TaxID=133065 RepID=UPI00217FCF3E|nr:BTB/POZ domain-containing protein 9-like [Adelges cooleyi]